MSEDDNKLLESDERKLLYVGMTRANDLLYLSSHQKPSRFIHEIDTAYLRFRRNTCLKPLYPVIAELNDRSNTKIDMSKTRYRNLYQVLDYYERSLKAQSLMDLVIDPFGETLNHIIDISLVTELFNSRGNSATLDRDFMNIFPEWEKQIKYQPDLKLYLGYPYIESRGRYIPVLYYALTYDIGKNQINLFNNDFDINGSFLENDLELTKDEKKNLIAALRIKISNEEQKTDIFDKLNSYFRLLMESNALVNKGILFLNSSNYTKGFLYIGYYGPKCHSFLTFSGPALHPR